MSNALNARGSRLTPMRVRCPRVAVDQSCLPKAGLHRYAQKKALDEEAVMVAKYAIGLVLLGITPLIALLFIYYSMPDLLLSFFNPPGK